MEIGEQMPVKSISLFPYAFGFGMLDLFQGPSGRVESAPGVTTRREPRPPISDVFKAAGGEQTAFELGGVGWAFGFTDDPISASQNSRWGGTQPAVITSETIMFGEHPQDPSVMLIITAGFVTPRTIENAVV